MKRIIKGRRYDTDTAKKIASYKNNVPGDTYKLIETLYRKKTGEYFICIDNKIRSKEEIPKKEIVALTPKEAEEWVKKTVTDPKNVLSFPW